MGQSQKLDNGWVCTSDLKHTLVGESGISGLVE